MSAIERVRGEVFVEDGVMYKTMIGVRTGEAHFIVVPRRERGGMIFRYEGAFYLLTKHRKPRAYECACYDAGEGQKPHQEMKCDRISRAAFGYPLDQSYWWRRIPESYDAMTPPEPEFKPMRIWATPRDRRASRAFSRKVCYAVAGVMTGLLMVVGLMAWLGIKF